MLRASSAQNSKETDGPTPPERPFCSMSLESWKESVIAVRGAYLARLNAVRRINANESLSSQKGSPTASARDWKGCYVTLKRKDGKMRGDLLPDAVNIEENGPPDQANPNKSGKSQELWPTPTAMSRPRSEETMEKCLKFRQSKGKNTVPLYLEEKVRKEDTWPTPIQTDCKSVPYQMSKGRKITRLMGKANGKLNPSWVEQLMGLPVGWTQLPTEWIASDCSETG